jgi:chaperone required for assembly of F1-ATPase
MRRFYRQAAAAPADAGHAVILDGRRVKTPAKNDLTLPSASLAAAIAEEWQAQQGEVRPAAMPLTKLAYATLDRDAGQREALVRQVTDYAGTDLVCYRAAHPPALAARQQAVWQPLLDWAILRYDAPLTVTAGVIPASQPAASLGAFAAAVAAYDDFALTALHAATGACGSLVIALALFEGRLDSAEAFGASQLDESFQIEAWGEDSEQAERRRALAADIDAAARFLLLLRH